MLVRSRDTRWKKMRHVAFLAAAVAVVATALAPVDLPLPSPPVATTGRRSFVSKSAAAASSSFLLSASSAAPPAFAAVDDPATIPAVTTGGSAIRALLDDDAVRWPGPPFSEARYGMSSLSSSAGRFAPPSDPDGAATFPPWLEGCHSARYKFARASFPQGRGVLSLRTPGAGLATCLSLPNVGYSPRAPHAVRFRGETGGGNGQGGIVFEDLAYNVPRKLESFWPESKVLSVRTNGERPGELTARCTVEGEGCATDANPDLHSPSTRVAIEYDGPTARRGGGRVVRTIDATLLSHEGWADGDSFCLASSYSQLNVEQGLQCFYREVTSLRRTGEGSVEGKVRVAAFLPRYVEDGGGDAREYDETSAVALYDYGVALERIDEDAALGL